MRMEEKVISLEQKLMSFMVTSNRNIFGRLVVRSGSLDELIIGDIETEKWYLFAIVKYSVKSALWSFFSNPAWEKSNECRVAGLEGQLLLATKILNI